MNKCLSFLFFLFFTLTTNANILYWEGSISEEINLAEKTTWSKALTYRNVGTTAGSLYPSLTTSADGSRFKIATNRCINVSPNQFCQITIELVRGTPQREEPYTVNVSSANISLLVKKEINGTPIVVNESSILESNMSDVNVNFFDSIDRNKVISLSIKNSGELSGPLSFQWDNNLNNATLILNRCTTLAKNKTCSISYRINVPSSEQNQSLLVLEDAIQKLSIPFVIKNSNPCNLSQEYYLNGSCHQIQYQLSYSNYDNEIPSSMNICDGTIISTRSATCHQTHDNQQVDLSFCSTPVDLIITSQSPSGEVSPLPITGGQLFKSCALGSSELVNSRVECQEPQFFANGFTCQERTFIGTYNGTPLANAPCTGVSLDTFNLVSGTCRESGNESFIVADSFCPSTKEIQHTSSAGQSGVQSISNGTEIRSCLAGQTFSQGELVSRSCISGYQSQVGGCFPDYEFRFAIGKIDPFTFNIWGDKAYGWGRANSGQIGTGSSPPAGWTVPTLLRNTGYIDASNNTVKSISINYNFSCAISSDQKAYCWGFNSSLNNLGVNGSVNQAYYLPTAVRTDGVLSGKNLKTISAGLAHACAVTTTGTAHCWGENTSGEMGNGTVNSSINNPTNVTMSGVLNGKTIKYIQSGNYFSCALASDDNAYCWGYNNNGAVGNGNVTNPQSSPVAVFRTGALNGKTVKQLSVGAGHACVVASDNKGYCWGYNGDSQIGNSSVVNRNEPTAVPMTNIEGQTFKQISAGRFHTCGISQTGKAYCWGGNSNGQIGNGNTTNQPSPVAVNTSLMNGEVNYILAGDSHTCAISKDKLYCWGAGVYGQLGDNLASNSNVPVLVTAPSP